MSEKKELNKEQLEKASGGGSSECPVVIGPLECTHCGHICYFTYNSNEVSGTQGDVRAYCGDCGEYKWIKVGAGR